LPQGSSGGADQVRRALESCGRDAGALAEVIAVAGELALPRTVAGDVCDVRGPRLAAAGDAAVAAGLLAVDGTTWRIRTEAIAHRVRAAIPDDRRRVIHREILTWLLDTDPDATHARASGDPRAAEWTRVAIERAHNSGAWERVLSHVDGLATCSRTH